MSRYLPRDGTIKLRPAFAGDANHAVGERRNFRFTEQPSGKAHYFTGRLAYDENFNLTVVDIRRAP